MLHTVRAVSRRSSARGICAFEFPSIPFASIQLKRFPIIGLALAGAVLCASAAASVESLDLRQMLQKADSAIAGSVTQKSTWEGRIDGVPFPFEFTTITVEGDDWVTGKKVTREITFLGSAAKPVSEMPGENETKVGTRGLFFSVSVGSFGGRENQNSIIAAQNGVFRIESGPKGDVVIGKGAGAAVEASVFATELRKNVNTELASLKRK